MIDWLTLNVAPAVPQATPAPREIAAGEADLYPRMGTTMQWDTAAGDAILRAAGGQVVTLDGARLVYGPVNDVDGPERFRNPWFIATGSIDPMGR